jgi:hypothetical protein
MTSRQIHWKSSIASSVSGSTYAEFFNDKEPTWASHRTTLARKYGGLGGI